MPSPWVALIIMQHKTSSDYYANSITLYSPCANTVLIYKNK